MNEKMSRQEVSEALDRRLSGLQGDPWLTAKVLSKAEGEKPVKKLSATAIIVIVLLVLTMAGALAAALNAWGVVDFAGNYSWTYVPENARDNVTPENVTVETDKVICTIQESYYDGGILRVTAKVEPKDNRLLAVDDVIPTVNEEDTAVTVAEYAQKHFDGRVAEVWLFPVDEESEEGGGDWKSNEDGSAVLYAECSFDEEMQDREVHLQLGYVPGQIPETLTDYEEGGSFYDESAVERTTITLKVHAVETETYVSEEPMDFPSAGVQMQKVVMTVTPLEIRCKLYYAITDLEKYLAMNDGLWFEFVDPAKITKESYFEQTFEGGMTGGGSVGYADGNNAGAEDGEEDGEEGGEEGRAVEVGTVMRQTDSLGLNAKGDEYTIRAYNCWDKTRYETVTFRVTKVE